MAEDREAFVENFEGTFDISTEMENRRIVLDAGPDGASGREQARLPRLKIARPLLSLRNLLRRQLLSSMVMFFFASSSPCLAASSTHL